MARLERRLLESIRWHDASSVEIFNAVATEKAFTQFGQAKELRPLDPHDHPDLEEALRVIDLNEAHELAEEAGVAAPTEAQLSPAAGRLPDPAARHQMRFWDGQQGTSRVSDHAVESMDVL